jgi:hypothetical protein
LSIALDPVLVDDLPAYTTGKTYQIPLVIQPDRLSAVRVFNNTPFDLLVNSVPGVNQVWLSPYTEDIYRSNTYNPYTAAFNSAMLGNMAITPVNLALRNNDTATTPLGAYHPYRVLITVYELGDAMPTNLPIVHNQMVSVVGETLSPPSTFVANTTFSGASATINLSIPDLVTPTSTIQYATVLSGFSVDLASSGSQHNNTLTITNISFQTVTIQMNIPATTPYVIYKNNLNWMSGGVGAGGGANNIAITFPTISGVSGSLTGWAFAERVP